MSPWRPATLDQARRAAWDADDWDDGVVHCVEMILRGVEVRPHATVLDFGGGPARIARPLSELFRSARIYNYEPNEAMWDHSYARNWPVLGPKREPLFDIVYSTLVFQHLDDIEMRYALADIARVLRPGGTFRLQYVNHHGDKGPLSHPRGQRPMEFACHQFGLDVHTYERDVKYPTWSWITAIKREDNQ